MSRNPGVEENNIGADSTVQVGSCNHLLNYTRIWGQAGMQENPIYKWLELDAFIILVIIIVL